MVAQALRGKQSNSCVCVCRVPVLSLFIYVEFTRIASALHLYYVPHPFFQFNLLPICCHRSEWMHLSSKNFGCCSISPSRNCAHLKCNFANCPTANCTDAIRIDSELHEGDSHIFLVTDVLWSQAKYQKKGKWFRMEKELLTSSRLCLCSRASNEFRAVAMVARR